MVSTSERHLFRPSFNQITREDIDPSHRHTCVGFLNLSDGKSTTDIHPGDIVEVQTEEDPILLHAVDTLEITNQGFTIFQDSLPAAVLRRSDHPTLDIHPEFNGA